MFGLNEIWLLLGLPLAATIYLIAFHLKATKWWELTILWGAVIVTIFVAQVIVEKSEISDTEYWGFNAIQAVYDEPFQYWSTCSETYACGETCSGTGSNRVCTTQWCTRFYPCKKWGGDNAWAIAQTGQKKSLSVSRFKFLEKTKWANSKTIELHREREYDIIVDGDRRVTDWPKTWQTAEAITEQHTYENRTQCSSTIRFQKVGRKEAERMGLFDYPSVGSSFFSATDHLLPAILDQNKTIWSNSNQYFQYLNGVLGPKRFLRIWVLIFYDKPRDILHYQQGYWKNGNKNEFIICIGADKSGKVMWGDVISWTEVEELKIEFRDFVEQKLGTVTDESLFTLAQFAEKELGTRYVKPEFTDKFKHLSVQPSTTSIVITAVIVLLVTIGVCVFVVKNDFHNLDPDTFPRRPYRSPPPPRKKATLRRHF